MRMVVLIVGSVWLALSSMAQGYELRTHARMTQQAHQRSMLGTSNALLEQLGLRPDDVLGGSVAGAATHYYDFTANTLERRFASTWETDRMPRSGVNDKEHLKNSVTAQGWLLRGAIREDDSYGEDNPQDDPFYPTLRRPLHHFYDPIFDRPLNKVGLSLLDSDVHTAPSWGMGYTQAQLDLAVYFESGHGGVKDENEAVRWYRRAADGGNVVAQVRLARRYELGSVVPKDLAEAFKWYRSAAERGYREAQDRLARAYRDGSLGVKRDPAQAKYWAAKSGRT